MKDIDIWHVEYLQIIQHFVIRYWNDYGRLPNSLKSVLADVLKKLSQNPTTQQVALFQIPREPGTGVWYEYKITGNQSFELCANIERDGRAYDGLGTPSDISSAEQIENWKHGAVHVCFSCAISKDGRK
jgi:hypothetical protein